MMKLFVPAFLFLSIIFSAQPGSFAQPGSIARPRLSVQSVLASRSGASIQTAPPPALIPSFLRCEYLLNPEGIDNIHPRLSWLLRTNAPASPSIRNRRQTAFQVLVAGSPEKLDPAQADYWNSGKIMSAEQKQVVYRGRTLASRSRCFWTVRCWDEHGRPGAWSEPASWSIGLLRPEDWKARWIGDTPFPARHWSRNRAPSAPSNSPAAASAPMAPAAPEPPAPPMTPSPLLRKEFALKSGPGRQIRRAMLYSSALGLAEITLNGEKIGSECLAPEWTDYHTRVCYQAHDVTGLLHKEGSAPGNTLGATLADGWYIGPVFSFPARGAFGLDRRFIAQLEIEYENGERQTIATDGTWSIDRDGPVRSASLYDGSDVDERLMPHGWDLPGFDDSHWPRVTVDDSVRITLSAQMNEPITIIRTLPAIKAAQVGPATFIYDLGQNMVGWCRLAIPGYRGDSLRLRYAEVLNEDGTLYTDNLRGAKQTDAYIGPPRDTARFAPPFTYHGFRYLEIRGLDRPLPLQAVTGEVIASSARVTGDFECSSNDLNQLWKNIQWTQWGNMTGVPTDCPQRDERAGWMGDAQVFSQTGIYNMDMAAFFTKWIGDIRDSQNPDGAYADFSPMVGYSKSFYNAPGWADAGVIVPWRLYENYGDKRILATHFRSMCRFIDYIHRMNPGHIWSKATGMHYGDWLNGNTIRGSDYPKEGGEVPIDCYATAFYYYSTTLLAKSAKRIGETAAASRYGVLAGQIRAAYNRRFVKADGSIQGDTQAGYALALAFGLLPESLRPLAAQRMAAAVHRYDDRVSTGIQSTIRMMNQLCDYGYAQLAYTLLESDRFPSWLYSIRQGATTIWERWDGYVKGRGFQDRGMNSFNHYAIGSVGEWLYSHILGIAPDTGAPGFSRFLIRPLPGGSLTWAGGSYESINGMIRTKWEIKQNHFFLQLEVPPNTTALVRIPRSVNGGPKAPAGSLTERGLPVRKGNGILSVREDAEYEWLSLGSGDYAFAL